MQLDNCQVGFVSRSVEDPFKVGDIMPVGLEMQGGVLWMTS